MALKIIDHGTKEYQKMIKLRDDILRKPLGITFDPNELEEEKNNLMIGAFEDGNILGCAMLVEENSDVVKLRQMAVLNALQGKGIGRVAAKIPFDRQRRHTLGKRSIENIPGKGGVRYGRSRRRMLDVGQR